MRAGDDAKEPFKSEKSESNRSLTERNEAK